jgi:hypothetical protein
VNNRSFGREKLEGGELIGWQLKSRHRSKQVPKRAASEERSLSQLELDLAKKNIAALVKKLSRAEIVAQIDHFHSSRSQFW